MASKRVALTRPGKNAGGSRIRYTQAELELMARVEMEMQGKPKKALNDRLVQLLPARTRQSIQIRRGKDDYIKLLTKTIEKSIAPSKSDYISAAESSSDLRNFPSMFAAASPLSKLTSPRRIIAAAAAAANVSSADEQHPKLVAPPDESSSSSCIDPVAGATPSRDGGSPALTTPAAE